MEYKNNNWIGGGEMGNKKVDLNTVVDTLQCDILREKMENERILMDEHHAYIKPSTSQRVDDNYNRVKISPKHLIGYENTNSRKNIDMAMSTIAERIGVTKMDIDVNRMDISIDSNLNYEDYCDFIADFINDTKLLFMNCNNIQFKNIMNDYNVDENLFDI